MQKLHSKQIAYKNDFVLYSGFHAVLPGLFCSSVYFLGVNAENCLVCLLINIFDFEKYLIQFKILIISLSLKADTLFLKNILFSSKKNLNFLSSWLFVIFRAVKNNNYC